MSLAFAQYLQDFGSSGGVTQLTMMPEILTDDTSNESALSVQDISVDIEAEKASSYQEGYSAASQALSEEHAKQLELLAQSHKEELAKKEDESYTQISKELMNGLTGQIDQASQSIKSQVSAILMQVIEESFVHKSIEQLDNIVGKTLKEHPNSKINIFGPPPLLEKIKARLGEELANINFSEAERTDLTVEIDQTILKTRLSEWHKNFGDDV